MQEEENASHRPEYLTQNIPRNRRYTSSIETPHTFTEQDSNEEMVAEESEIHKTMWAIRRIPRGSRVQCQGQLGGQAGKCKKNIKNTGNDTIAASFWGIRTWDSGNYGGQGRGSKAQYMWFCNDNIDHTWRVCNTITHCPGRVPTTWPVEKGTNLTSNDLRMLEQGGFNVQKREVKETTSV